MNERYGSDWKDPDIFSIVNDVCNQISIKEDI